MTLAFDKLTHTYTVDGRIIPSVTQVLKEVGIVDYSFIPQDVLVEAARRGTLAHLACQYLDDGQLDRASLDQEIAGYVESYERWKEAAGFKVAFSEQRLFNRQWRYAGTLDRTGFLGDSRVCLDFKTGVILPGHAMQLAAYTACLPDPLRWRRIALKLHQDGSMATPTEYPIHEFSQDFAVFTAALACVNWKRSKGAK